MALISHGVQLTEQISGSINILSASCLPPPVSEYLQKKHGQSVQ